MDLNEDDLELPAEEFSSVITIPTSDFAKYDVNKRFIAGEFAK